MSLLAPYKGWSSGEKTPTALVRGLGKPDQKSVRLVGGEASLAEKASISAGVGQQVELAGVQKVLVPAATTVAVTLARKMKDLRTIIR